MTKIRISDKQDIQKLCADEMFVQSFEFSDIPTRCGDYYFWGRYKGEYVYSTYMPTKDEILILLTDTLHAFLDKQFQETRWKKDLDEYFYFSRTLYPMEG